MKLGFQWHKVNMEAAHITENSILVSEYNRRLLYAEWRRYWNPSKHVLLETSPIHTLKTRFLQSMFGANQTFFLVVLRHPLGSMLHLSTDIHRHFDDCGAAQIESWYVRCS